MWTYLTHRHTQTRPHRLTLVVFDERRLAYWSALCFAVGPAGVFMSAGKDWGRMCAHTHTHARTYTHAHTHARTRSVYTEAPFALCSFAGMLLLHRHRFWISVLMMTVAGSLRSNGIMLAGYLGGWA